MKYETVEKVLAADPTLLATSPNEEQIKNMIQKYWYTNDGEIELKPREDGLYDVYKTGKLMPGFYVKVKKGRWRFEHE